MSNSNHAGCNCSAHLVAAAALLACGGLHAQEAPQFKVTGGVSYGIGVRTSDPDPTLLFANNARAADLSTTNTAGRNQDDGNMNYRKGDVYSNVLTGFAGLNATQGRFSAFLRVQGWYDYQLENRPVPWGHSPNGFAAGQPLSDDQARARGKFSNVVLSNAWARGSFDAEGVPVTVTVGNQNVGWRGYGLTAGPMSVLDPIDAMARSRPGVAVEDTSIPITALRAQLKLPQAISIDGYYQIGFRANQAPVCGTFFSVADRGEDGCGLTMVNAGSGTRSDRELYSANHTIRTGSTLEPSAGGQFGLRTLWQIAPKSEIAFSVARYHSRIAYMNLVKSSIPGNNPFLPNDPRNPQTQTVYPQGITAVALEFKHDVEPGTLYGSVGYSPNRPIGYPAGEVVQTFAGAVTGASLFRAQERATAAGGVFEGWDRRRTSEWQAGWVQPLKNVMGATAMTLRAEVNARMVHDLPDPTQIRYARPEVFGVGPINGACATGASAVTCTNDGYVSKRAWGYALQAVATYGQAIGPVSLRPRIGFAHNVEGYSFDGLLKEGRKSLSLGMDALHKDTTFSLGVVRQWGSVYDNASDRNYATASVSHRF